MALTKKDIENLKTVFATKQDLEQFATKKDLERFATKQDLEKLDIKIEDFRKDMMTSHDKIIKMLETRQQEDVIAMGHERDQDRTLEDYGKRISLLERATA